VSTATASPWSASCRSFPRRARRRAMPASPHIMIVEAPYYAHVAEELARGAIQGLDAGGASYERFAVPGAFEIPAAIRVAIAARGGATGRSFDGHVALGCVIRGETAHDEDVCADSARGL